MPIVVVMFAMGSAMGQFGCYAYDGALRLSFSKLSNETGIQIPTGIDVLFNILRATSLFHIFYGFCLLLVFHLSLIFMIQSSMREFNGKNVYFYYCQSQLLLVCSNLDSSTCTLRSHVAIIS